MGCDNTVGSRGANGVQSSAHWRCLSDDGQKGRTLQVGSRGGYSIRHILLYYFLCSYRHHLSFVVLLYVRISLLH